MILGGICICIGLFVSSCKANAYTAGCDHLIQRLADQIALNETKRKRAANAVRQKQTNENEIQHDDQDSNVEVVEV